MLDRLPATDPTAIFRFRDGIYASDLLIAGVCWLDFFTWLAEHPSDLDGICRSLGLQQRPADVMLTLFAALGLVRREGEVFHPTELALEHLVGSSPFFIGSYLAALKDRGVCRDLLAVLRHGRPASWCSLDENEAWASKMEDEAFALEFTAAMDARATFLAPALARRLDLRGHHRLLDVAGGSGIYSCAIVATHPHLSATVLEKPPVDRVARQLVGERGFAERVAVVAGDIFAGDLPRGHDVHLWSNVMHDWDVPQVKALLRQSAAALPPGGMILVHDAHLDADKAGPLPVAMYSTLLMHSTEGRCYSVAEMEEYLRESGCVEVENLPTAADRSVVVARKAP